MNNDQFVELIKASVPVVTGILEVEGAEREARILANARYKLHEIDPESISHKCLIIEIPFEVYKREKVKQDMQAITFKIHRAVSKVDAEQILKIESVYIQPYYEKKNDPIAALHSRRIITNQGRVRSDRIAPMEHDGLLFRSQPEINLYQALKRKGVCFCPLPVLIKGGQHYIRMELDFLIIKDGLTVIVEVDGSSYHTESPAEAYERLYTLEQEGARVIRIKANDCLSNEGAMRQADLILSRINRLRSYQII